MQPKPMVIYGYSRSDGKWEVHFQMCGDGDGAGGLWSAVVAKGVLILAKAGFGGKYVIVMLVSLEHFKEVV